MNELNLAELHQVNGGAVPVVVVAIGSAVLGAATGAIINGWSDFKQGFQTAYWHQQKLAE